MLSVHNQGVLVELRE